MLKTLLGQRAEARAETFLIRQGVTLVARNWHCRFGEIDLIVRDGATLVFVEVRQRSRGDYGGAVASVTPAKQKKLLAAARLYLTTLREVPPCRFDVVGLDADQPPVWLRNVIEDGA